MVFEPTFESIDEKADALPDLEGTNPFAGDEDADVAEGAAEAALHGADAPLEELPPYGEQ